MVIPLSPILRMKKAKEFYPRVKFQRKTYRNLSKENSVSFPSKNQHIIFYISQTFILISTTKKSHLLTVTILFAAMKKMASPKIPLPKQSLMEALTVIPHLSFCQKLLTISRGWRRMWIWWWQQEIFRLTTNGKRQKRPFRWMKDISSKLWGKS